MSGPMKFQLGGSSMSPMISSVVKANVVSLAHAL